MTERSEYTTPPTWPSSPLDARVQALEVWRFSQERDDAVQEERRRNAAKEFERVNARLDRIDQHVGKIVWLLIVAILGAFMSFVIQGGLSVAGA